LVSTGLHMCRAYGAIFALVSVTLLTGADGASSLIKKKKEKKQSDMAVAAQIQDDWKTLWRRAANEVATKCKANCHWGLYYEIEIMLKQKSDELIQRAPHYKSTLRGNLQLSQRGLNPAAHNTNCRPSHVHGRDDFCICAREHLDWQTDCDYATETNKCQSFLSTVCDIKFFQVDEDYALLEGADLVGRLRKKLEKAQSNKKFSEEGDLSETTKEINRLQGILHNLEQERDNLMAAHAEHSPNKKLTPMLVKLDQRIQDEKDRILEEMDDLIEKRQYDIIRKASSRVTPTAEEEDEHDSTEM